MNPVGGPASGDEAPGVDEERTKFWVTSLRGAVATFVIGLLPLDGIMAPVAGGALAGYLRDGGRVDGLKIGAVAGTIGGVGLNVLAPPRFFGLGGADVGSRFYLVLLFGFVVWAGTSAFGGALGAQLAERR